MLCTHFFFPFSYRPNREVTHLMMNMKCARSLQKVTSSLAWHHWKELLQMTIKPKPDHAFWHKSWQFCSLRHENETLQEFAPHSIVSAQRCKFTHCHTRPQMKLLRLKCPDNLTLHPLLVCSPALKDVDGVKKCKAIYLRLGFNEILFRAKVSKNFLLLSILRVRMKKPRWKKSFNCNEEEKSCFRRKKNSIFFNYVFFFLFSFTAQQQPLYR